MEKYPTMKNSTSMQRIDVMILCIIAKKPPAWVLAGVAASR